MRHESPYNEQALLQSIARGDEDAFEALFGIYWSQVFGLALRITKSPEQAKDLAQDIFVKLWDNRAQLGGVKNLPAYVYTISRNLIHDHIKGQVFRENNYVFLVRYFEGEEGTPMDLLEQRELADRLMAAVRQLPPQLRKVFSLSRFEGLSHEEIARRLHITPQSSKTYMVRALILLRERLSGHGDALLLVVFVSGKVFFF
jgi:RNA polymerase sigma-70 factor (ECF subfamily)